MLTSNAESLNRLQLGVIHLLTKWFRLRFFVRMRIINEDRCIFVFFISLKRKRIPNSTVSSIFLCRLLYAGLRDDVVGKPGILNVSTEAKHLKLDSWKSCVDDQK